MSSVMNVSKLRNLGNKEILVKSQNCMGTEPNVSLLCKSTFLALGLERYAKKIIVFQSWLNLLKIYRGLSLETNA